jgi:hypothetical protein
MTATRSEETTDAIDAIKERSADLVEEYSVALTAFIDKLVPSMLTNSEYAARCSALLIALNRQLARCAAAFGEVHGIDPQEVMKLIAEQFSQNHIRALNALREGGTLQ